MKVYSVEIEPFMGFHNNVDVMGGTLFIYDEFYAEGNVLVLEMFTDYIGASPKGTSTAESSFSAENRWS